MLIKTIKGHYQLALLAVLVGLLWTTPIFLPLRLLVVYLHELSHVLAAWATGGTVISLNLSPLEGGEVLSQGGNLFIMASAGYLGSLLVGVALFVIAVRTHVDRIATACLGGLTLVIAALYVRTSFALGFCLLTGFVMLVAAWYLSVLINDILLRVIGLSSMFYVPWDICSDTILRTHLNSDARILAENFGGTTMLWGLIWLAISVIVIGLSVRYGVGKNSNFLGNSPTAE